MTRWQRLRRWCWNVTHVGRVVQMKDAWARSATRADDELRRALDTITLLEEGNRRLMRDNMSIAAPAVLCQGPATVPVLSSSREPDTGGLLGERRRITIRPHQYAVSFAVAQMEAMHDEGRVKEYIRQLARKGMMSYYEDLADQILNEWERTTK